MGDYGEIENVEFIDNDEWIGYKITTSKTPIMLLVSNEKLDDEYWEVYIEYGDPESMTSDFNEGVVVTDVEIDDSIECQNCDEYSQCECDLECSYIYVLISLKNGELMKIVGKREGRAKHDVEIYDGRDVFYREL